MEKQPSFQDFLYFIEVAAHGKISVAADKLRISQPSLTIAMRRLEEDLACQLFVRSSKGVRLTGRGIELYSHVKNLKANWDDVMSQMKSGQTEVTGRFSLGVHPSVATYTLPKMLPKFLSAYPKVGFSLAHGLSRTMTEQVLKGQLDAGIVVNPMQHPDLVLTFLCADEVTFWHSPTFNKDVLICDPDLLQSQSLNRQIKKAGKSFQRTIFSSNLEVIRSLAETGTGTAILPTRVAQQSGPKLKKASWATSFKDEVYFIYRIENKRLPIVQAFKDSLKGHLEA